MKCIIIEIFTCFRQKKYLFTLSFENTLTWLLEKDVLSQKVLQNVHICVNNKAYFLCRCFMITM